MGSALPLFPYVLVGFVSLFDQLVSRMEEEELPCILSVAQSAPKHPR
jgi:hypothetical protein